MMWEVPTEYFTCARHCAEHNGYNINLVFALIRFVFSWVTHRDTTFNKSYISISMYVCQKEEMGESWVRGREGYSVIVELRFPQWAGASQAKRIRSSWPSIILLLKNLGFSFSADESLDLCVPIEAGWPGLWVAHCCCSGWLICWEISGCSFVTFALGRKSLSICRQQLCCECEATTEL